MEEEILYIDIERVGNVAFGSRKWMCIASVRNFLGFLME